LGGVDRTMIKAFTEGLADQFVGIHLEGCDAEMTQRLDEGDAGGASDLRRPALADAALFVPFHGGGEAQFPGKAVRIAVQAGEGALGDVKGDLDHGWFLGG